ncbi:protein FAM200A-like [Watersipora subatra]|uniref:protein FAM200A-like n=1 Tax=Watersipora subatra TaxID=2589382 RepID=UPI00355B66D2
MEEKVAQGNFSMFESLSLILEPKDKESISMHESLQSNIISHWKSLESEYQHYFPETAKHALRALLPFVSPYLCEFAFSSMVVLKSKQRNQLGLDDMRCALSTISPKIENLVKNKEYNPPH